MYKLIADVYLTRRARLHHVMADNDELKWSGSSLIQAIEYLVENGQREFRIEGRDGDPAFLVMAHRD